jgi:hypothetical protein
MKFCRNCKRLHPRADFIRDRSRRDGLDYRCRESCRKPPCDFRLRAVLREARRRMAQALAARPIGAVT